MRPLLKVVLSTLMFSALHSLLASASAKQAASRLIGQVNRDRYYRAFFNLQSVLTSGALVLYILRLPDKPLWRMTPRLKLASNLVRLACLIGFIQAVRQIHFSRVSGFESLMSARTSPKREPEAQGPALDAPITGPFRFSRHPLNFLAIPLIWLTPRMTRNKFAFNCVATLYFLIGSLHEEQRMRAAWGQRYHEYCRTTRFILGSKSTTTAAPPQQASLHPASGS